MDIYDRATEREEEFRDDAIADVLRRLPQDAFDHPFCACCEEPIPEARRRALPGVDRCVECQEELEAASEHFHRGGV